MNRSLQIVVLFCLLIVGLMTNKMLAVPAYPKPVQIKQPNGITITVILKGDEKVKWAETLDGYTIMRNSKGVFEYATQNEKGDLSLSGITVSDISARKSNEISLLAKTKKRLAYSSSQISIMKSIYAMKENEAQKAFPTAGSRKLVCILMGFKNKAFTKTQAEFNDLFNQVGYAADGATGSVKDYYNENSYNQFDLTVTVAGPFTAANNMSYYGGNGITGIDQNPEALVSEAVELADPTVNFANFDNDNDGSVDGVYVIFAGYGEEAGGGADCIWSHAYTIPSVTKDGKTINKYSCSPELRGTSGSTISTIGVICHEFGHVMGAPDYYDVDYQTGGKFEGSGHWDLMALGSWNNEGATPAHHNAYTKTFIYGWAPVSELTTPALVTVTNAVENKSFFLISSTTANEFWIMENRQKVGFDANIPGHGLIIYHVHKDLATGNRYINATYPQKFYPVCANATSNPGSTPTSYGSIDGTGCPFPGSGAKTQFTDATTPNMKSWDGINTEKPITNIVENITTNTITFNYGGSVTATVPTATTVAASGVLTTIATLNAQVNANNATTNITFEYGPTTSYGSIVNGTPNTLTGASLLDVTTTLTGLTPNTNYNYRVKTVNSLGTSYGSNMTFKTMVPLDLPLTENFDASTLPNGWITQNIGSGVTERWSISNTKNAGGAAYELKCTNQRVSSTSTTRVVFPAISTLGLSSIALTFKHMFKDYLPGLTLRIQTSKDMVTWTNDLWSLASSTSRTVGPETINTVITNNLNLATTYIAFVVEGNLYQFEDWYIDDIKLIGSTTTIPIVTTTAISGITSNSAISGGDVIADGGAAVTERGVCYATTPKPIISNPKVISGTGTGTFTANMSNLTIYTTYYVRAYATNPNGTAYGAEQSFETLGDGTYCISKGNNTSSEWIDLVQFAGINNKSASDGGYKDNTSMVGTINKGATSTMSFSAGLKYSSISGVYYYWAIWIDYNQNGTFEPSEKVVSTSSDLGSTLTANIVIPTTALLGKTRMRVSMKYNSAQTACEVFGYGEVEDYTINITAPNQSSRNFSNGEVENQTENNFASSPSINSDNSFDGSFTVFPNPASDKLTIQFNAVDNNMQLKIYDISGSTVRNETINSTTKDIDISNLPKGVYIISIEGVKKLGKQQFIKR